MNVEDVKNDNYIWKMKNAEIQSMHIERAISAGADSRGA